MDTRTVRRTTVTLPGIDDDLTEVAALDDLDELSDFAYTGANLRELTVSGANLMGGRICGLTTGRAHLNNMRLHSVEFTGCDVGNLRWADSKVSRVRFTDCRLLGAAFDGVTLEDVVFEGCRLDYATFARVRAAGPLIFTGCSLREARFTAAELNGAAFDGCELGRVEFDGGAFRDCDLRGNDLGGLLGVRSLRQVIVDRSQLQDLGQALAAELNATFGEDLT
jgi:uncharacterized protein YjbI with pentapeptide repeats